MILVTGSTGFIGSHVARSLVDAQTEVRALIRSSSATELESRAEIVRGDLSDREALDAACAGVDAIVHAASKNVDSDGSGFQLTNVDGTRNLCDAAIRARVKQVVYVSSVGVYGHGEHRWADESTPVAPDTPFSRSKAAAEQIVIDHHRAGDFDGTVLRHRFVYGEGDELVVPRLMAAVRRLPFWVSGGRARLSFVLARDFAEVTRRLLAEGSRDSAGRPSSDPVYHVTSGEELRYRDLAKAIGHRFGYRTPRVSLPRGLLLAVLAARERLLGIDPEQAPGLSTIRVRLLAQDNSFSNAKLLERFPDLDLVTFAEGLERSLDYYREFA